jgi:2'-5' RNA ligase
MSEQKRVFIAIDISDEARKRIAAYIEGLRRSSAPTSIKFERPEKVHLTLKFLGDSDPEQLRSVTEAVRSIAHRIDPFTIEISGTGAFPDPAKPRILWLGIKGDELASIVHQLDEACEPHGFESEKRDYRPHLTIARIRDANSARDVVDTHLKNQFAPVRFEVRDLTIYESQLLRSGSVYARVARHNLGEAPSL